MMGALMGAASGGISGGAGGISPSSSATATNGDFGASSGVGGFTINYGNSQGENMSMTIAVAVVFIVGLLVWLKK